MANVLLLRSPTRDGPDQFEDALKSAGYTPLSVPVLETAFKHLGDLKAKILEGRTRRTYDGVIITSGRACEAWKIVLGELASTPVDEETGNSTSNDWSSIPFYVVGIATAKALADIRASFPSSPYAPHNIRGGSESGTSEKLANFIMDGMSSYPTGRSLLYLTGDKNRDTLPNILEKGGIKLETLQVYETQGSSRFAEDLQSAISSVPHKAWWLVYFAPSAAEFATPILRSHFDLPLTESVSFGPSTQIVANVAAIGPTTSAFLRDHLKVRVDITPCKPEASALLAAILGWDHGKRSPD